VPAADPVWPVGAPGPAPAVPAPPAVCHAADAYITRFFRSRAVGPGLEGAAAHWSATLVALVTLNCFVAPLAEVAPELEFIPALPPADVDPVAEALAPLWSGEAALPAVASAALPLLLPLT
jgi:hypothetical protein